MHNNNAAFDYDLSIYENVTEKIEQQNKPEKLPAKMIKAKTGIGYGFRRMCSALTIAVFLSLVVGVIYTNASITSCTNEIYKKQKNIVQLESQRDYLNFQVESRMSLKEIEEYAIGTLGLVKLDSSQVEYVEIEEENKIEIKSEDLQEKIEEAVKPILSYFMP